jgi:hypothetical protein
MSSKPESTVSFRNPLASRAQQSSRFVTEKQRPALPGRCFDNVALQASSSSRSCSRQPNDFNALREWLGRAIHFGFGAEAGEVPNRDWAASASSSLQATCSMGKGYSLRSGILYTTFLINMQCSMKFFAGRYLGDIVQLSLLASCLVALRQRQANRPVARIKSDEERETQVYDCPFYGLRSASH